MGKQRYWPDYLRAVRKHWEAAVFGLVGSVLGLIESQVTWTTTETVHNQPPRVIDRDLVPTWVWFGLVVGGLGVAQFRAWRDLATQGPGSLRRSDLPPALQTRVKGTPPPFSPTEAYVRDAVDQLLAAWGETYDEVDYMSVQSMLERTDRVSVDPRYEPLHAHDVLLAMRELANADDPRLHYVTPEDGTRVRLCVLRTP